MQGQRTFFWLAACAAIGIGVGVSQADPPIPGSGDAPRFAMPSETKSNLGYYVGGGNPYPRLAEPRGPEEGTWGWDYQGWLLPRRVMSGWWHGRRYQGGTGAYKVDGPKLYNILRR